MLKKTEKKRVKDIQPQKPGKTEGNVIQLSRKLKKYSKFIANHPFLFSFITITVLFIIELLVFVPVYHTNDDNGMSWVVSGISLVDKPDEHLLYQNIALGFLLKKLYTAAPHIPWYGSYHFLIHFLSMVFFLYAILSRQFSWTRFSFFLVFFIGVELYFLNNLQFTITSFMAGQTGVFLFLAFLEEKTRKSWIMLAASVICLLISSLGRIESFYLVILVAAPGLLITFIALYRKRSVLIKFCVFVFLTLSLSFLLKTYNTDYYANDPAWKDFHRINTLKARFIDFNQIDYTDDTKHIFDEVKWSKNDLYILRTWFYADDTIFSAKNMEKVASHFPKYKPELTVKYVLDNFRNVFNRVIFLLVIAVLFLLYVPVGRIQYAIIISTVLLVCLVMLFLLVTMQLPERVYHPMVSFIVMLCLSMVYKTLDFSFLGWGITKALLIALVIIGLFTGVGMYLKNSRYNVSRNREFRQTLARLNPRDDQLYVIWGASLPYENILPFENTDYLSHFKVLSLSTYLPTPFTRKQMEKYSIKDVYRALYEKENVLLIVNNLNYLYYYTEYVREHYGTEVQFSFIYRGDRFTVLKVISEGDPRYNKDTQTQYLRNPYRR